MLAKELTVPPDVCEWTTTGLWRQAHLRHWHSGLLQYGSSHHPRRKLNAGQKGGQCTLPPLPCQPQSCQHIFWISSLKLEETRCAEKNEILPISSAAPVVIATMAIAEPSQSYQARCYWQTNMSKPDWGWVDCVVQMALAKPSLLGWTIGGNSIKLIWASLHADTFHT